MAKVAKITKKKYEGKVYDLAVDSKFSYNIEGLAVHNSGAGSLVLYVLGVIGINSLDYNLSMDRFLYAEAEYRIGKSDICQEAKIETFETSGRGSRYRKTTPEEDAKVKRLVAICSEIFKKVHQDRKDTTRIKEELRFINEKRHTLAEDILVLLDAKAKGNINKPNSYILEILGLTAQKCDLMRGFDFKFVLDKKQSRISPPDIDIDFDHREPIVRHMCELYGYDKVALIGNNMMYKPKAAVQFVAKALDITDTNSQDDKKFSSENTQEAIRLSKMMTALPLSLKQWLGEDPKFKSPNQRITKCIEMMQAEKARGGKYEEVFEIAKELCGDDPKGKQAILKSFGTHAAGLIVSSSPIIDDIPLHTAKIIKDSSDDYSWSDDSEEEVEEQEQTGLSTAQFDKNEVEELGLLKFDFLQIETLRHMNLTMKLIKDRYKKLDFDIENLVPNDTNVFKTINDMKLAGIFQLSGNAFIGRYFDSINKKTGEIERDKDGKPKQYHRDGVMKIIGCSDFNDIVVSNALGRPGPMASGMVKEYAEVKFGRKKAEYAHPLLEKHLKGTYGQLVYQEQMIETAQELAGFSFAEADNLRRACGHKDEESLKKVEIPFREGCRKNGISELVIEKIYNIFLDFCQYGFNLAHCLTGDTPVFSADSNLRIPIRDLKPENNILSYLDGHVVRDSVVELIDTGKQKVFEITLSNGMKIKSTVFHKFWCSDQQYHEVYDIIQDDLEIVSILPFSIENVTIVSYEFFGFVQTYNIEMASEQHNYLVGDESDNAIVSANSTGYGYISYQTAYLKTYYPTEFICSILTTEANKNQDKLALMINKFKGNKTEEFPGEYPNLKILKPDINKSEKSYIPVGDLQVLAPIFSIKSIGKKVSDTIVEHRKKIGFFSSVEHFFRVVNSGGKAAIAGTVGETLIDAGVFDSLGKREDLKKELKRYFQIKRMVGTKMHQTSNMQDLF